MAKSANKNFEKAPDTLTMKAIQVFYEGHVQGVGFRWMVKNIAHGYEISGWVRNLEDGRVELQVSAEEEEELEAFLTAIQKSALAGNIRKTMRRPLCQTFKGFEIHF